MGASDPDAIPDSRPQVRGVCTGNVSCPLDMWLSGDGTECGECHPQCTATSTLLCDLRLCLLGSRL